MSIEQSTVVDGIGVDKASGKVILTISDHLPWHAEHYQKLEEKLASYIAFIESGQLLEQYSDAKERKLAIHVFLLHEPDEAALRFLEVAKAAVNERSIEFWFGALPTEGFVQHN